ncbi:LysR family transcriptional regulator [Pseudokordiimonas caeni]|uniref:LysR family transcriptional regulator n=1 Tax=Pseudokordiimonas caeni TaxID=2997908 RepID=UPI0028109DC5|nr:LysR family transcriptional regulator [Pseudokordiimonas caeni]
MDRIDAMRIFVTALDEGSLAGAGRRLNRSPAAITRAITFLENHVGIQLLHRTTRSIRLTEAGERYAAACRRVLNDLEEADIEAAGEKAAPRGLLTITSTILSGNQILRPIIDTYLDIYPDVRVQFIQLDRIVNVVEEGVDIALRIAHLPDSSLIAVKVGEVRRILVASPDYLAANPPVLTPADLTSHRCIPMSAFGHDGWTFPTANGSGSHKVPIHPRLMVNTMDAAIASATEGHGIAMVMSYQVADALRDGRLKTILDDHEATPRPVHLVMPAGRLSMPKVRAFVDFAVPLLKEEFARRGVACSNTKASGAAP